jgi:hypothetical protein
VTTGALLLIALGIGVQQSLVSVNDEQERRRSTATSLSPSIAMERTTSSSSLPRNPVVSAMLPSSESQTAHPIQPTEQNRTNTTDFPATINPEDLDPTSVIGRPFPVSASVEKGCRRGVDTCDEVYELLLEMAQEPRDFAWATDMEAKLRDYVKNIEPDKFSIRTIECRTSLCVVEVASIHGPLFGIQYKAPLYKKLSNSIGMFGYEADPSSARVTVTLLAYTRR